MMPGNIDWTDELDAAADVAWAEITENGLPETSDIEETEEPTG